MERLTGRRDGRTYIIGCPDFALPKIVGLIIQQAVDRLAAYEDTGLEPEEIDALPTLWMEKVKELSEIGPIDRLRELAQADRLIGETVYYPYAGKILEKRVSHFIIYDERRVSLPPKDNWFCIDNDMSETFDFEDIGKTVFLTREEAEAALEGMKNG